MNQDTSIPESLMKGDEKTKPFNLKIDSNSNQLPVKSSSHLEKLKAKY